MAPHPNAPEEPVEVAQPVPEPPKPPLRSLESIVGPTIAFMIEKHPTTPNVRGEILRSCNLFVPDSVPAEGLAAWVQENYKGPAAPAPRNVNLGEAHAAPPAADRTYEFEASYDENVRGRARFTATRSPGGSVEITEEQMRELAEGCSSVSEFLGAVQQYVEGQESFDSDCCDNYEYDDEEVTDSEGRENWEYPNLTALVEEFFANNPTAHPDYEEPEEELEEDDNEDQDSDDDSDGGDEEPEDDEPERNPF